MSYDSQVKDLFKAIKTSQKQRNLPFQVTFELTPLCNFDCKMCYVHISKKEQEDIQPLISVEKWNAIADECEKMGVLFLGLTGGEILTYPGFQDVYEHCYQKGFLMFLLTNGYLWNNSMIDWISKRKPYLIKITIYGASDQTYEKVCGIKDGHTVVINNILKLKAAGITVVLCMTVTKENENDVDAIQDWAKSLGIPLACSNNIKQPVRGAKRNIDDIRIQFGKRVKSTPNMDASVKDINYSPFLKCRMYRNSMIISWRGNMLGCNFINSIQENVNPNCVEDQYQRLWDRLDSLRLPPKCRQCNLIDFCNPCPGALEGETGNPETTSDYVCGIACQNYNNLNIELDNNNANTDTCECSCE